MGEFYLVPVGVELEKMKRIMKQKRIRQGDLANAAGVKPGTVSNWLNGRKDIPVTKLLLMAAALRVTLSEIIRNEPRTDGESGNHS